MANDVILREIKDYVGTITLNRPEALNTFSQEQAEGLVQAMLDMDADRAVRVIIIKGAGKCFSAGIDVSPEVMEAMSPHEFYEWITLMEKPIATIGKLKKPVIASVHGFAVANGIGVVAGADLAVAEEGVKFGATAINVGLNCIGPQVSILRNIGKKRTLELVLRGNLIDAAEAERFGLINKVVPKGSLEEETMKLAKELAEKSPLALQIAKKSFYDMEDLEFDKAMELVNQQFAVLCSLEDSIEGIKAFNEKRKPVWKEK